MTERQDSIRAALESFDEWITTEEQRRQGGSCPTCGSQRGSGSTAELFDWEYQKEQLVGFIDRALTPERRRRIVEDEG